jgi:hypothetical protein
MVSVRKALFVVAVAALAFASFVVVSGELGRDAEAQVPAPADGEFWVFKDCSTDVSDEFTITVALSASDPDEIVADFDETFDLTLSCDGSEELTTFNTTWDDFAAYIDNNLTDDGIATISEVNLPDFVTPDFSEECTLQGDDLADLLEGTAGFVCTVTNTIDLPDLVVAKDCPAGPGASQFSVIVREAGGGPVVGFDNDLDCTQELVLSDLAVGLYEVSEIIGGADAYDTEIECDDVSGLHSQTGQLIVTSLEPGVDAECVITNTLIDEEDDAPGDGIVINNTNNNIIDLNNQNTNNNSNSNANDNQNTNENTNTQNQTNNQSQTNNNTQTTDVVSSPEVNITGAGAPSGHGSGSGGGGGGSIGPVSPPSTGDGGLLGLSGPHAGIVTWGAVASVLALVALGAGVAHLRKDEI